MRRLKVFLCVAATAFATSALADTRVVSGPLTLRDGPGATHRSVLSMAGGTPVELLGVHDGWGLIRLPGGETGWARANRLVRPFPPPRVASPAPAPVNARSYAAVDVEEYTSVVWPSTGNLNLRAGPGTHHPVIMGMPRGDIVEVFQLAGPWAHVRCITGEVGWAHTRYLTR